MLFLPQPSLPAVNPFWADRFTILGRVGSEDFKLFNIIFPKNESAVYIDFPYCPEKRGLAAVATMEATGMGSKSIDMSKIGKLTSHPVKFSYHQDGRVHFSQDGKVKTEIAKRCVALEHLDGHMFTAYFGSIDKFAKFTDPLSKLHNTKKGGIILVAGASPGWIKVVGYWFRREVLARRFAPYSFDGKLGPVFENWQGQQFALLGPHKRGRASDFVLCIRAVPHHDSNPDLPSQLFLGGFDSEFVAKDLARPTTFLMFKYPTEDFDSLKVRLASIDYAVD